MIVTPAVQQYGSSDKTFSLPMKEPLLAVDIILILHTQQQRMAERSFQGRPSKANWAVLVVTDAECAAEKLLKAVYSGVLN